MQKYHCNVCLHDVDTESIEYLESADQDICPNCGGADLDYYEEVDGAKAEGGTK
jgi:Zn-finger nucleic acid-binding protein